MIYFLRFLHLVFLCADFGWWNCWKAKSEMER